MSKLWFLTLLAVSSAVASDARWVGSKVCSGCHAEIYRTYSTTAMATTSGPASDAAVPEQSFLANRGFRYSIVQQGGKVLLDFGRADAARSERRELSWFVGSGSAARSYLISVDGFLYEAPATYYSRPHTWGLSPGYNRYNYPFLTRAIAPGCLQCHATGIRSISGTQNGYEANPFLEGGIGCERCHGPGAAHAASGKPKDIVNPLSLSPERRDSTCAQCHLSGEIRVDRAGKSMNEFVAGDKLSDYTVAFVRANASTGMKVTGHVESLAQSACSRASGNRLWCGTCHDAHAVPSSEEKASWYRSKCQSCHAASVCRRGDDCVSCHMPLTRVTDAQHVVYTDHSIQRRPVPRDKTPPANSPLIAFGGVQADTRELGLAYAIVALREQSADDSSRAFDLLRRTERQHPEDPQALAYLADLYKTRKDDSTAASLYRRLYAADPTQSSAPANLGAYQMEQGRDQEAISFFREALRISPGLVLVRMDLAVALVRSGRFSEARSVLLQTIELNPSFAAARNLLSRIPSE